MKTKNKFFAAVCSLILLAAFALSMAGCEGSKIKITFDYNYDGAPEAFVQEINKGDMATEPDDPAREGYRFDKWYEDRNCDREADFGYSLNADTTYYAGWVKTVATVTLIANYAGGTNTQVSVNIGSTMSQPSNPVRENYLFTGWYTTAACSAPFDFSSVISADTVIYAGWEQSTGEDDTVRVTFANNYAGAQEEAYYSTTVKKGRRVAKPADPVRQGYAFLGWYTEAECETEFDFRSAVDVNTTIYAYWLKEWAFEAEYTDVSAIHGHGYSGEFDGTDIILRDSKNKGASNDFFVSYLYGNAIEVVFEINAEEATTAVLQLSLAAEQSDVVLSPENYTVQVNGQPLQYSALSFTGAASAPDKMLEFKRYTLSMNVSLNRGHNVIKLITSNSTPMTNSNGETIGTMYATAPVVDCLYLCTDVTLGWTESKCFTSNISGK